MMYAEVLAKKKTEVAAKRKRNPDEEPDWEFIATLAYYMFSAISIIRDFLIVVKLVPRPEAGSPAQFWDFVITMLVLLFAVISVVVTATLNRVMLARQRLQRKGLAKFITSGWFSLIWVAILFGGMFWRGL